MGATPKPLNICKESERSRSEGTELTSKMNPW